MIAIWLRQWLLTKTSNEKCRELLWHGRSEEERESHSREMFASLFHCNKLYKTWMKVCLSCTQLHSLIISSFVGWTKILDWSLTSTLVRDCFFWYSQNSKSWGFVDRRFVKKCMWLLNFVVLLLKILTFFDRKNFFIQMFGDVLSKCRKALLKSFCKSFRRLESKI